MSQPHPAQPALAVLATHPADLLLATHLSAQLGLPLAAPGTAPATCVEYDALLLVSGPLLSLQQTQGRVMAPAGDRRGRGGRRPSTGALPGPVSIDFGSDAMRHRRRSGHNELLGRAVGVSGKRAPHVLDATAGLGRDGFVLADMGCAVTLCERNPVIAAMLAQALQAAVDSGDQWLQGVAARMRLHAGDVRALTEPKRADPDVIYLDPMFPPREKSAAVKKEMALFHALLGGDAAPGDADELFAWALQQAVARVVVKRPARAPVLAQSQPSHSLGGKAVRFDVYVRRALS